MANAYTVLVVDDEPPIRRFLRASLAAAGHRAVTADDAAGALAAMTAEKPDLVILDLGLPDRSGFEVIAEIRKHSPVPIIVLSARSDERSKVEALDLGADDYIGKPFGMAELMARLRAALRHAFQAQGELPMFMSGELSVDLGGGVAGRVGRGGHQMAEAVGRGRVPGIGRHEIGQVGERHAGGRVGPAIGGADPAMPESGRRSDAAKTADAAAGAAGMRADAAMHRDIRHRLVGTVAGEIAGDVFDHPLREQPHRA